MVSERILAFYKQLKIVSKLPKGVQVLNPYLDEYTSGLCEKFYTKYYNDNNQRTLLLGINPGRFGSGTTGISFTDPVKLEKICGIENTLLKKTELSADFIYTMIHAYGGLEKFYQSFFFSSVSPLGFTKENKNINYYDDKKLEKAITPFAVDSISKLIAIGMNTEKCFCIGEGENYKFLKKMNDQHKWFEEIVPLAHPRFVMQYRRKFLRGYVEGYLEQLRS